MCVYTHHINAGAGLVMAARMAEAPERGKYVLLTMDKMNIKEDIVYDKHTGTRMTIIIFNMQLLRQMF